MKLNPVLIAFAVCAALVQSASAQLTPQQAVAAMGRGINLGNTLEPPTEGAWNNGPAQEFYFDDFASAGFQTVRVPVRWDQHTGTTAPYSVSDTWMDRVEQVVDWGLDRGFTVILNAHHEEWLKEDYANADLRARFDSIWVQIADRFKDKPDRLLFEIINEPFGMTREEVDDLNARVLEIIRRTNPTRIVIYSGNEYSSRATMMAAAVPDDDYLIAYFHQYDPWEFAGLGNGTWGSSAQQTALRNSLDEVAAWSASTGIPVVLSEFGALQDCDYNSRQLFFAKYVEESLKHGIPFQLWDDGGMFAIYDRSDRSWNVEARDVIAFGAVDGPAAIKADVSTDTLITLSWSSRLPSADSTVVERRTETSEFERVGAVFGAASHFDDRDVEAGHFYYYRLIVYAGSDSPRYSYAYRTQAAATQRAPFHGVPFSLGDAIEAEDYDIGGEGLTFHDSDLINEGDASYRPSDGVDIETRTDGGYHVAYIASNEWLEYTVDIESTGIYELSAEVAMLDQSARFRFEFPSGVSESITVPNTGSWETTTTVSTTMNLTEGVQPMRVFILYSTGFNIDRLKVETVVLPAVEPDLEEHVRLDVYPNPTAGLVRVELERVGATNRDARVEVVDLLGRSVKSVPLEAGRAALDLSDRAVGTYLVRVVANGKLLESRTVLVVR
ncbi:MAG: cellulase family glycosylhydrolase [Rhodothermales bacterium]